VVAVTDIIYERHRLMRILLVAYDNGSFVHQFPQGLSYLAAVMLRKGHDVEIYNQDKHHYPDEHLTEYLNRNKYDVVGVGVIGGYYQYRKLLRISEAINKSKQRPYYVLGGHGPSPEPEYFLRKTHADTVVRGEGEVTILELLDAIEHHKPLNTISGIAYLENGKFVVTEKRSLINDVDTIPFSAYDLFPMDYYRLLRFAHVTNNDFVMSVLSGRGCPFKCNFCYRMDEGFRPRSSEGIIEEIKLLKNKYGVTYIMFSDELLMSSESRTISLYEDFLRASINIKWECAGRLNYAKPKVLQLMKKAGCVFISYGIESVDDNVLKNMNKALSVDQINKGIEATLKAEISPGFNIIFGNIGEDKEILNKGVEFLLKYDDGAQLRTIRSVTPYPGSPLYYYAIKKGLLKDCADFYENKHVNSDLLSVNFTNLTDEEFNMCLLRANKRLINNYFKKKQNQILAEAEKLYLYKNENFRGFRQT